MKRIELEVIVLNKTHRMSFLMCAIQSLCVYFVLVCLVFADKHPEQNQLGEERIYSQQSITEGSHGRSTIRDLRRNRGMLLLNP